MDSSIPKRVQKVRKTLNITQEKFGEILGVTRATISKIESGERSLTERMAKSIAREFNVDYLWLTEGGSDDNMFTGMPETIIDVVVNEYRLTDVEKQFLKVYLELPKSERNVIMRFFKSISENTKKDSG